MLKRTTSSVLVISGVLIALCLSAAGSARDYENSIKWDGYKRTYRVHLPSGLDKDDSPALLIALHGGGGKGKGMWMLTKGGLNELADKDGFIVAYPDGYKKHWNDGRRGTNDPAHNKNIDDVGFIKALIDTMIVKHHVDPSRIYVAGISNGGMMAYRLACELSDRIAAIAVVATAMPLTMPQNCSPSNPVSVIAFSGTQDPLVPFEGDEVKVGLRTRGKVLSVYQSVKYWINRNGCAATADVTKLPDFAPGDGTRVRKEVYADGKEDSEVILYVIEGGGHTWPGGLQYLGERTIGKTCQDIDANELIWEFFKRHSR
jgi:polyhydroxybutyrate depolymerase